MRSLSRLHRLSSALSFHFSDGCLSDVEHERAIDCTYLDGTMVIKQDNTTGPLGDKELPTTASQCL